MHSGSFKLKHCFVTVRSLATEQILRREESALLVPTAELLSDARGYGRAVARPAQPSPEVPVLGFLALELCAEA